MSGNVWMFSDEIDDEDLEFMRHDYVTYNMACEYYRLGIKPGRNRSRGPAPHCANTTDWESNPLSVWHMKQGQYIKLGKRC